MQGATRSYYCQAPRIGRADHEACCVQAYPADAAVMRQAELTLREGDLRRAIREASRASSRDDPRAALEARLAEVDAALSRAVALAHSGMPADVIMAGNAPLLQEREAIRAQLATIEAMEPGAALRELAGITPAQAVRRLQGAPVATQVVLLGLLFERVEVLPGRTLRFVFVGGLLEPEERLLPRYWSVKRGLTDLGW